MSPFVPQNFCRSHFWSEKYCELRQFLVSTCPIVPSEPLCAPTFLRAHFWSETFFNKPQWALMRMSYDNFWWVSFLVWKILTYSEPRWVHLSPKFLRANLVWNILSHSELRQFWISPGELFWAPASPDDDEPLHFLMSPNESFYASKCLRGSFLVWKSISKSEPRQFLLSPVESFWVPVSPDNDESRQFLISPSPMWDLLHLKIFAGLTFGLKILTYS